MDELGVPLGWGDHGQHRAHDLMAMHPLPEEALPMQQHSLASAAASSRPRRSPVSGTKRTASEALTGHGAGFTAADGSEASPGETRRVRGKRRLADHPGTSLFETGVDGTDLGLPAVSSLPVSPGKMPRNKWGLRGVRYDPNKKTRPWEVKISMFGKDKSLGYYETKEEAGIVYDIQTIQHRGASVLHKLNFPDHPRVKFELEKSANLYLSGSMHTQHHELDGEARGALSTDPGSASLSHLVAESGVGIDHRAEEAARRARLESETSGYNGMAMHHHG